MFRAKEVILLKDDYFSMKDRFALVLVTRAESSEFESLFDSALCAYSSNLQEKGISDEHREILKTLYVRLIEKKRLADASKAADAERC